MVHLLKGHHFQEGLGENGRPDLVCCGRGREEHPPTGIKGKLVINDNLPPAPLREELQGVEAGNRQLHLVMFMYTGNLSELVLARHQ